MCKSKIVFTFFLFTILFELVFLGISFADETLTISTYYPSPYGSYRELLAHRMKIGVTYSAQNVTDNNLIVEGDVGIGVIAPKRNLQVNGMVSFPGGGLGDINNDGVINALDYGFYYIARGGRTVSNEQFGRLDANGDGVITDEDFPAIQQHYFQEVATNLYVGGRVGIGTMSPQQAILHIDGERSSPTTVRITNDATGKTAGDGLGISVGNSLEADFWNYENGALKFATNNTVRMTVANTGNVGIGTEDPKSALHVMNLPVYTSNNLAKTGGLTVGAFYRNGDNVCVVY